MIRVQGLRHRFGQVEALRGIDLEVAQGEVFGLVGPDGAGKTTLLKVVAGLLKATQGQVTLEEPRLGFIPQRFSLYRDLTVGENIDFFARLYGVKDYARRQQLLETIGLAPFTGRLADQLSGGMKQKLALLCSLVHSPPLLLMDEPTTGVDPVSRREFWGIIFALQRQGLTVLASTPYMDEAEQFDRVALIHQGSFLRVGTTNEIRSSLPGTVMEVRCQRPMAVREALIQDGLEVEIFGDKVHVFLSGPSVQPRLEGSLKRLGLGAARPVPYSIEDVFLRVTT